jgi:DNA invertase Pin-like site-specific DNA recombinase
MLEAAIDSSVAPSGKARAGVRRYVAYYRLSIGRLEQFALGFEAQRAAVEGYIAANPGRLIAEFSETVSGRKNTRPKLQEALYLCRLFRAVLVIARLDRLSRSVELITRLLETGTEFVAVDFPHATKFTIHLLAAIAEYESQLISQRMKAAHAAARERDTTVWPRVKNPNARLGPHAQEISARNRRARVEARARDLGPLIWKAIAEGKSYRMIADEFNRTGVRPRAKAPWCALSIWLIAKQSFQEFGAPRKTLSPPGMRRENMLSRLAEIGPRLAEWRREGMSCTDMACELNRLHYPAPRGGLWAYSSLRRYLLRKMNLSALDELRVAAS